jgi:hypothetical protein
LYSVKMSYSANSSVMKFILLGALLLLIGVSSVYSHSYVTSPTSRSNQKQSESGCRGPACLGPCDVPLANMQTTPTDIQRGAMITVQWPRNNHAGGFIRFAWALTANSDSATAFDSNVQEIHCHEIGGCAPEDPSDPNGGDNGTANGSLYPCQVNISVPLSLTDASWTLQWAWFGGAFALGDYYSCVDYVITGGPTGSAKTPLFYGGDYSYPGQPVCKFFNTDRLGECVDEPCSNPGPIYPSEQQESGPAFGIAIAGETSSSSPPTATSTTSAVSTPTTASVPTPTTARVPTPTTARVPTPTTGATPSSLTTGHKEDGKVTTGHKESGKLTTGSAPTPTPLTTGSVPTPTPLTSGSVPTPSPTPTPPTVTTGGDSDAAGCTAGNMKCVTSETWCMCDFDTWQAIESCPFGTTCHPTGAVISCY